MENKRYCLALDLNEDSSAIEEYIKHHRQVPSAIRKSIVDAGIEVMDIYLTGNRLFMIMEVNSDFSFDKKAEMDRTNSEVQKWEALMAKFQKALPWAGEGEKWVVMEKIFGLDQK